MQTDKGCNRSEADSRSTLGPIWEAAEALANILTGIPRVVHGAFIPKVVHEAPFIPKTVQGEAIHKVVVTNRIGKVVKPS